MELYYFKTDLCGEETFKLFRNKSLHSSQIPQEFLVIRNTRQIDSRTARDFALIEHHHEVQRDVPFAAQHKVNLNSDLCIPFREFLKTLF